MRVRLALSIMVLLLAFAASRPCFAKEVHAQHGARASATNSAASGKGATGANPAPSKANVPIDTEATVAPPVLPPHGVVQQQIRIISSGVKTLGRGNAAPTARNAIGQPVVPPKNIAGAQPPALALQRPGALSPPIIHGGTAAPPISSAARVNLANATNRGSVNGAIVIRPATGPSVIGGPAQARYGINGTMVQNRH
jgi:hypothetical protein